MSNPRRNKHGNQKTGFDRGQPSTALAKGLCRTAWSARGYVRDFVGSVLPRGGLVQRPSEGLAARRNSHDRLCKGHDAVGLLGVRWRADASGGLIPYLAGTWVRRRTSSRNEFANVESRDLPHGPPATVEPLPRALGILG